MKRADLTTVIIRKEIDIEGEDYGGGGIHTQSWTTVLLTKTSYSKNIYKRSNIFHYIISICKLPQCIHYQSKVFEQYDFLLIFKELSSAHQAWIYLIQNTEILFYEIFLLFKITAFYVNIF